MYDSQSQERPPLINPDALDRFAGNPELTRRLVSIFTEIAPEYIEKIHRGVEAGRLEQVAFHAHSLKGSSAELGAERLSELGRKLQLAAKADNWPALKPLAEHLSLCLDETIEALKEQVSA